ncbi:AAA family ATPase [Actinokineospora terrae]|uniref:Shikimate kinase n=1 Tax=Actinokineospora terrae TaxID=155974 RepID=A0A1H9TMD0_9PSEU|nr:AAA family ATPase [Actinokineospora terrae]SER97753.1 shikimate kinase [Actinokineospora terrae]
MAVVLVTGMSGVGKSAALGGLARLGYRVVDTDHGGWVADLPLPDGTSEPQWREERIDALIAEHERSGEPLVIAGTVLNQARFYPRFAEVVLLSAPLPVMLERVAARETNPYGKTPEERARIAADTAEVEPLLRASATVEIDTRAPLDEVVARLAELVSGGASRR